MIGYDHSLWILYANGMNSHYQTEPHILAGASSPTLARRNMTLPDDSGQNLVEWRFRKEQTRTKVTVFGRKLRVRNKVQLEDKEMVLKKPEMKETTGQFGS